MTQQKRMETEQPRRSVEVHQLEQLVELLTEEQVEETRGGATSVGQASDPAAPGRKAPTLTADGAFSWATVGSPFG